LKAFFSIFIKSCESKINFITKKNFIQTRRHFENKMEDFFNEKRKEKVFLQRKSSQNA